MVDALRKQGALQGSLVAEAEGHFVGRIAFSKTSIDGVERDWHGLVPLGVLSGWQNQGISSRLVCEGLEATSRLGACGCVLVGNPTYHTRFGFRPAESLNLANVPPGFFLMRTTYGELPSGTVAFHPVFTQFGL